MPAKSILIFVQIESQSKGLITRPRSNHSNYRKQFTRCKWVPSYFTTSSQLLEPVSGELKSCYATCVTKWDDAALWKTKCRCSVLVLPHSIYSRRETTTCLKVSEVEGGEPGGDWARARCHCSIKKREGFLGRFLGSKNRSKRGQ